MIVENLIDIARDHYWKMKDAQYLDHLFDMEQHKHELNKTLNELAQIDFKQEEELRQKLKYPKA